MQLNRANLEITRTGFRAVFLEGLGVVKPKWRAWAHKIDSVDAVETLVLPEGVGEMYARNGSPETRAKVTRTYDIRNEEKINRIEPTVMEFKTDKLGVYNAHVRMMGATAGAYPDKLVTDLMKNGFTTTGPDGVAFFSASHPVDGGVQSNLQAGALSPTTFRQGLTKLQSMTDYYGRSLDFAGMGLTPTLVVGPDLEGTATEIVEVMNTTGGAGNPNYKKAKIELNTRLIGSYEDYWFLGYGDGLVMPFAISEMEAPNVHQVTDPEDKDVRDRGVIPIWAQATYGAGYAYYHLIVGSPGT